MGTYSNPECLKSDKCILGMQKYADNVYYRFAGRLLKAQEYYKSDTFSYHL